MTSCRCRCVSAKGERMPEPRNAKKGITVAILPISHPSGSPPHTLPRIEYAEDDGYCCEVPYPAMIINVFTRINSGQARPGGRKHSSMITDLSLGVRHP